MIDVEPGSDGEDTLPGLTPDGTDSSPLTAYWPNKGMVAQNWGDKLNPVLITALTGRAVRNVGNIDPSDHVPGTPVFYVIGSSLSWARQDAIVWGSGFIQSDLQLSCSPERVVAARGPLSRKKIAQAGGDAAMPLGDPALLLPLLYRPAIAPSFDVGIIQHFREVGTEAVPQVPQHLSHRVIDITGGVRSTIDAVLSCKTIVSSSLHGVILAHAYGRRGIWVKASDRPLGDDFKFRDYWSSIGHDDYRPFDTRIEPCVPIDELVSGPGIVEVDLFALIEACPFLSSQRKQTLIEAGVRLSGGDTIFSCHAGLRHRDTSGGTLPG